MASLVSSFLHHSANKIDHFSSKNNKKRAPSPTGQPFGQLHQATLSTPIFSTSGNGFYQHQASQSAEWLSPPPYDPFTTNTPPSPPIMSPSSSWTTSSMHTDNAVIMDRRSISQGMKLVSIAADEYDEGNEAVALDIYLTGLDKILMALPNQADAKTKLALREKLLSVEERVGILSLAHHRPEVTKDEPAPGASLVDAMILQKITHTWQSVTQAAAAAPTYSHPYQQPSPLENSITIEKFKQLSHVVIQASVTLAILIKQSPIPALLGFCFHYLMCLMLWVDAQYGVRQRAHAVGMSGLKAILDTNEQYRLHEFITEFLFMVITATLKAVVAYRETPRHTVIVEEVVENDPPQQQVAPQQQVEAPASSSWLWSVATRRFPQ